MEEALVARLRASAGVSALVSDRVDWLARPQGDALPSVTLQVISPGRGYTHEGADGLANSRVQIDCWGTSYGSAKLVARAVVAAMEPPATQGTISFAESFLDAARDFPPEDIAGGGKVYRVSQEWSIWWQPA